MESKLASLIKWEKKQKGRKQKGRNQPFQYLKEMTKHFLQQNKRMKLAQLKMFGE